MNYKSILHMLSNIMLLEAICFLPSIGISAYDGDIKVLWSFIYTVLVLCLLSVIFKFVSRNDKSGMFVREGFLSVALTWIVMSLFGALPFFISGEIPNYLDAVFETVSGFTTTGSSIITDVESMSRGLLLWRSFTHWLGGMGILVFVLAVLPAQKGGKGDSLYVLRAESPGPTIEKLVPKIQQHSMILYSIYLGMTVICFIFLAAGGMPLFDSVCITLGTAGTGGFGIKADSMGSYSTYCQAVVTVFMLLFGINFNIYFLVIMGKFKSVLKDEELKAYLIIFITSTALVAASIYEKIGSIGKTIHHAAFTTSTIMTTTGYATVDFNLWDELPKTVLILLMVVGGCAGSTAGGLKVSRLVLLIKSSYRELRKMLHPRAVIPIRMNGVVVSDRTIHGVNIYLGVYMGIMLLSFLVVSRDNFSMETNLSAVVSCLNNIGPGLGTAGPMGSFAGFSWFSKLVLTLDMLIGRLEIFPMLMLMHYKTWKRV